MHDSNTARKRAGEIEADTGSGDDSDGSAASAVQQRTLTPPGSPPPYSM